MERNREEIIKALECCVKEWDCAFCRFSKLECASIKRDALALIKELTEENERLKAENARYEAENHAQFDKWLKLEEATKRHHSELFEEAKIAVKEDTVRKMQERLMMRERIIEAYGTRWKVIYSSAIDQIAKEMLEGDEGK